MSTTFGQSGFTSPYEKETTMDPIDFHHATHGTYARPAPKAPHITTSDTPRTDAEFAHFSYHGRTLPRRIVSAHKFARDLERQLATAQARVQELEQVIRDIRDPRPSQKWQADKIDAAMEAHK